MRNYADDLFEIGPKEPELWEIACDLVEEVNRLRIALAEIADETGWGLLSEAREIAREALNPIHP